VTAGRRKGPSSLFLAGAGSHTVDMAEITAILVAGGVFSAGFVAWYTLWHRRMAAAFERVPVGADRSVLVVRRGADLPGNRR
jgi:hypothetical protein